MIDTAKWTWVAPTYEQVTVPAEGGDFTYQVLVTPSRWTGGATASSAVSGLDPNNSEQMKDYYAAVASGQIKPQDFSTLFSNQDRMMSAGEFARFSPEVQAWAKENPQQFMQQTLANRNSANQDLASVGAEGGYSLPQNITTGANGLDYSKAGYMNINDGGGFGDILPYAILAAAAIYTGGAALGAWGAGAEAVGAAGAADLTAWEAGMSGGAGGISAGTVGAGTAAATATGEAAGGAAAGTAAAAGDAAGAAAAAVPEEIASGGASLSGYTLPAAVDPAAATASKGLIDTALTGAGRSAAINGAVQFATTGKIDPGKLAISAAAGGFGGVLGNIVGDATGMPFAGQVAGAVGGALVGGALSGGGAAASGAIGGGTSTGGSGGSSDAPTVNPSNLSFNNPGLINRTAPRSINWSTPRLNWSGA